MGRLAKIVLVGSFVVGGFLAVASIQSQKSGGGAVPLSPSVDGFDGKPAPSTTSLAQEDSPGRYQPSSSVPEVSTEAERIRGVALRYQALARAAEAGDVSAAQELYRALSHCEDQPQSVQQVDAWAAEERERFNATEEQVRALRQQNMARLQPCLVFSQAQRQSLARWLELAADAGDSEARLKYSRYAAPIDRGDGRHILEMREFAERADRYRQLEIERGNLEALQEASEAYTYGRGVSRDPVKAFAYAYAEALATAPARPELTRLVAHLHKELPNGRVKEAEALGETIYRGCCIASGG